MAPGSTGQGPKSRSALGAVALPAEHGGWALTAEPVLLGLLVAPSIAGGALGVAALGGFLARTPLKVLLVDRWRHRRLPRTVLAERVVAVELVVAGLLIALAALQAHRAWWAPLVAAAPLVVVELWFDMRSRSRRLVPEMCGAVGVAAVAAAVAMAGGTGATVALGLWVLLAARSIASIPFARAQISRVKGHAAPRGGVELAQAGAVGVATLGWAFGTVPAAAMVAIVCLAGYQLHSIRRRPAAAITVLGVQQLIAGLAIVLVAAAAIRIG
jgi:hypothetical protein